MNPKKTKFCPMTFNKPMEDADEISLACEGPECAWWNSNWNKCSVLVIATAIGSLDSEIKYQNMKKLNRTSAFEALIG